MIPTIQKEFCKCQSVIGLCKSYKTQNFECVKSETKNRNHQQVYIRSKFPFRCVLSNVCSCKKMQLIVSVLVLVKKTCCAAFFRIGCNLQSNNANTGPNLRRQHLQTPPPQRTTTWSRYIIRNFKLQSYSTFKELNLGAVLGLEAAPRMDGIQKNPKENQNMC